MKNYLDLDLYLYSSFKRKKILLCQKYQNKGHEWFMSLTFIYILLILSIKSVEFIPELSITH